MKKKIIELSVLLSVIIALSAIIIFRNDGKINYELPKRPILMENLIDKILIESSNGRSEIRKVDNSWIIVESGKRVGEGLIDQMLNLTKNFTLVDMVSQSNQKGQYGLDDETRTKVTIYEDGSSSFIFYFGKVTPSGSYTYVQLEGDDNIYSSRGIYEEFFLTDIVELRDKVALKLDTDSILTVEIVDYENDNTYSFASKKDIDGNTTWINSIDNTNVNGLSSMLITMTLLTVEEWLDESFSTNDPIYSIVLSDSTRNYSIDIYTKVENGYIALSSEEDGFFVLSEFEVNHYLSLID